MKYITLLIALFIASACDEQNEGIIDPVVIAYYVPKENYEPEKISVEKLTHIIFSFTHVIDGQMKFRNPDFQIPLLRQLVEQKRRNPQLRVMIACGGWGADGFSDMALSKENRTKFILSVSEFIEEYKLDGLDIDWEYPSISGAGTKARKEDKKNFTLLMQELRIALDNLGTPQVLTFASAGWKRYYDNIELEPVMEAVDFMNIMTYDQVSGASIYTGHHTPLGAVSYHEISGSPMAAHLDSMSRSDKKNGWTTDSNPKSAEKIVDYLLNKGVKSNKLVIGSAFYGRAWKGVPPARNGLYQLSRGIHHGWYAYSNIREQLEQDSSFQRYWDKQAKAPYFYNKRDSIMVTYDDTVSVKLKMEYAIEKGLAGVMFWQLSNDSQDGKGLLDALYSAAN